MAMYTSREDARSDIFLSGAWYLFGPIVVGLLIGIARLDRIGALRIPFALAFPVIFTALVPLLLMRYRGESLADLGIGGSSGDRSFGPSLLAAAPLVAAAVIAALLRTGSPLPATVLAAQEMDVIGVIAQVLRWVGLLFLAYYATVKARDAFGGDAVRLEDGVVRIGHFVGIAAAAAIALVIIAQFTSLSAGQVLALLCYPLGVAAAVWLLLRRTGPSPTVSMPTILTPVVLLAIGPFVLTFNARVFVAGVLLASVFAGLGLIVAVVAERTRRGTGLLLLGVILALATRLDGAGILG